VICEEPPTRPSGAVTRSEPGVEGAKEPHAVSWSRGVSPEELRRELAGDVDGILLKALEKDPLRRYSSVAEFSDDVRRHLEGQSVRARRHIELRAGSKFLQRHPWVILGTAAVAFAWANGVIVIRVIPEWHLGFVLVCIVSIGIGIWIASREIGTAALRRRLPFILPFILTAFLLGIMAVSLLPPKPRSDLRLINILLDIYLATLWFPLIRWPLRARRLGPLLLNASRRPSWFARIGLSFTMLYLLMVIWLWHETDSFDRNLRLWTISAITTSCLHQLLSARVEVREKGLAYSGMLLPWSKIQSYVWDPNPGKFEILRLRTSGVWSWFPTQILVKNELRSQFDAALTRQLTSGLGLERPEELAELAEKLRF
jgi:hypothetical protein